jgi:hypothetical protein
VDVEQASANTVFYRVVSVGAPNSNDQDFASEMDTLLAPLVKPLINNNATYRGVQGQIVWPLPVIGDVTSVAGSGVGTGGATAAPRQVSGLISWYTQLAGRAQRGRLFVPFPSTAFITGTVGDPTAGYITALNALRVGLTGKTTLTTGGRTATIAMIIYHRKTHNSDDVFSSFARSTWATQRRRGDRGRANVPPI